MPGSVSGLSSTSPSVALTTIADDDRGDAEHERGDVRRAVARLDPREHARQAPVARQREQAAARAGRRAEPDGGDVDHDDPLGQLAEVRRAERRCAVAIPYSGGKFFGSVNAPMSKPKPASCAYATTT